ncbi:hypothetical protein LTR97_010408 [Elasticomyces elasticus]|uniref:Uncharacterized protein n=1 Tax=Elasticomyces elasticus TaxID=574655 RepID=A0AAN7VNG3_9PEZI|nr:hypothetical protein LTR97_010408 [Elasticomyces elasticus]
MARRQAPKANPITVSFDRALMERCGITILPNAINEAGFSSPDRNFYDNTVRKDYEGVIGWVNKMHLDCHITLAAVHTACAIIRDSSSMSKARVFSPPLVRKAVNSGEKSMVESMQAGGDAVTLAWYMVGSFPLGERVRLRKNSTSTSMEHAARFSRRS